MLDLKQSHDELTVEEEHIELQGSTQLCLFLLFYLTETDHTYSYLKTHTSDRSFVVPCDVLNWPQEPDHNLLNSEAN
jgi:hypothetical protein